MKIVDKVKSNQKLMRFIETTQNRITDSEMGTTSVVVAYYLLLSLFPLMIALGNLLPYLSIDPTTMSRPSSTGTTQSNKRAPSGLSLTMVPLSLESS